MAIGPIGPIAIGALAALLLSSKGGKAQELPPGDAPPTTGAGIPWNVRSDEALRYQVFVNAVLIVNGFNPILEDGILGPIACAAGRFAADQLGEPSAHPSNWGADCKSFGPNPTPAGTPSPGTAESPPPEIMTKVRIATSTLDPVEMRRVADEIEADGWPETAQALRNQATGIEGVIGGVGGGAAVGVVGALLS